MPRHGQLDQEVAPLTYQPGKAGAFRADDECDRHGQVNPVIVLGAFVIFEPGDPHPLRFEIFYGLRQVRYIPNPQVLHCSG